MPSAPKIRRLKNSAPSRAEKSASERGYGWPWSKPHGPAAQARERDGWMCVICVKEGYGVAVQSMGSVGTKKDGTPYELYVDHIIPKHVTNDDSLSNLQTLCKKHHDEKTQSDLKIYGAARR